MARVISKTRSTKQLKTSNNTPDKKQNPEIKKIKKTKDGWEMTAHEALKVNFVVSEI